LGEIGLAAAGGPDEQDVRLGDLDGVLTAAPRLTRLDALVVVVDGHRERLLGRLLPHDVLLEELEDLLRLGQLDETELAGLGQLLLDDLVAEVDALVADVHTGPGDELLDLLLALAAEGALEQISAVTDACHGDVPSSRGRAGRELLVPEVCPEAVPPPPIERHPGPAVSGYRGRVGVSGQSVP
jgi:hypothetical protein